MVMKYPTATALAKVRPNVPGSQGPFKQRPLKITPRKIPGVTLPKPPVPKGVGLKFAGRGLARFVPGVGTVLIAADALQFFQQLNSGPNPLFWQKDIDCGYGRYMRWNVFTNCGSHITPPNTPPVPITTDPVNTSSIHYWSEPLPLPAAPARLTFQRSERWVRISGAPVPTLIAYNVPMVVPISVPFLNPAGMPLSPVVGTPRPKPWPEAVARPGEQPSADPEGDPAQQPRPGQAPKSRPIWNVPPMPFPITIVPGVGSPTAPTPRPSPQTQELIVPAPGAASAPRVNTRNNQAQARNRSPRKREKEKKIHVRTVAGGAWALINVFIEGLDFLDVIWKALPDEKRSKGNITPYDKAKDVYDHIDEIDIAKAVENYLNNQIEDMIYGTIGKQVAKAQGVIGSPTGLSRVLSKSRQQFMEEMEAELELPEIHWDEVTGEIYLTGLGLSSR